MNSINEKKSDCIRGKDEERIGDCAEQNAGKCNFDLGALCRHCSVWIDKNISRNCPWVQKN